ncbi:MAG: NAD-dependent epimerase/dehydratase family protein [Proteobacteria bacterium]|nr:NAD-dependent epimerase/dehydratase family protein [Pseudomonadota bacterium]
MSEPTALVIGGTGPTGHFLVNGLLDRGFRVTIAHTGRHEVDEIPPEVEHIHTNPFDESALKGALGDCRFDLTIATYGRLRRIAGVMVGRTGKFISVGGGPAYRGYMNPQALTPPGLPVPTPETATKTESEAEDGKGYRVFHSEVEVFAQHPDATHFRYPYVYGPYQIAPREWCIVRRILDGREQIIVPDDGLTLSHFGYAQNVAHAVLLAVDQPEVAAGQVYNCGDETVLTLKQVVAICAAALDHEWEIVSMPYVLAVPARPMIAQPWSTHRVFDLTRLKADLGYRDQIEPAQALAITARWLRDHPLAPVGTGEKVLQDPFDYAAEDELLKAWFKALESIPPIRFKTEPWYTTSYSGPGGSKRRSEW